MSEHLEWFMIATENFCLLAHFLSWGTFKFFWNSRKSFSSSSASFLRSWGDTDIACLCKGGFFMASPLTYRRELHLRTDYQLLRLVRLSTPARLRIWTSIIYYLGVIKCKGGQYIKPVPSGFYSIVFSFQCAGFNRA